MPAIAVILDCHPYSPTFNQMVEVPVVCWDESCRLQLISRMGFLIRLIELEQFEPEIDVLAE